MEQALVTVAPPPRRIAVALSGGADSAMMAVYAAIFARRVGLELHFFHVHHGLQAPAELWQAHVHDLARWLNIACHSRMVSVDTTTGAGIESAARDARYAAFKQMADQTGVRHIVLAHHQNDQAETVLLRLLRGSGPGGLAAMAGCVQRQGLTYLRPWLDIERAAILQQADLFFQVSGWAPVHDPTNSDDKYTRAAVRERLVPELNQRWPGWQVNVARHARLSAQMQSVLDEVAVQDMAGLDPGTDGCSFSLAGWRTLSVARQALVLRHWLSQQGLLMPTEARLQDFMRQLRGLHAMGHDRQMQVKHGSAWIRCTKGRIWLDVEKNDSLKKR
ncbi:tRNA lysidine(34) synthetase TilS [Alcaligenaceae bacterium]|nr:tRNA lysidine(34) synthetase TilS [Alcaligenaceae bacterium]